MIKKLKVTLNSNLHLKEILTGSAITFVLKMSGMLLGYIVMLIISRQYKAEGVGVYNLTLSVMTFVTMLASMGMNISILRYVGQFNRSGEEQKLKLLYRYAMELVIPFSLLLAVLLYFFADVIAIKIFNNPIYKPALEIAAIIVPFMALQNISIEFIRGLKQLKISEFLRSVNSQLISICLLLTFGLSIVNKLLPVYVLGIGIILGALFSITFITKKIWNIEVKNRKLFLRKELILTSIPMMFTSVSLFILGNISLYMLEAFSTTDKVGIFSVSLKISMLISMVLIVLNTISAPKFSELYWNKEYTTLQKVINQSSKIIFFVSLPIAIIVMIFNKYILGFFGDEFILGSTTLLLLILGQIVNSATGSVGVFLNMTGNQKVLRNIIILAMCISIILNYMLIPFYGLNGAAFASMVSAVISNIVSAYYVKTRLGYITYFIPNFLKANKL